MSLNVHSRGSGAELVLIHGWGLHSGIWSGLLPQLEQHFRVTCIDLPGHGRSDWQGQSSLHEWVTAVLEVAPQSAVWLGWSLGGLVAAQAALSAPGRVTSLVMLASTPSFVRRPGWQSAMLPALLDTFASELQQDFERTLNRFLALQVRGSEQAGAVLGELRETMLAQDEPDAAALQVGLEILRHTDLRNAMQVMALPLLLIMGERDTLVPANAGTEAQALCSNAQLQVIKGAGHAPFLVAPGEVSGLIENFMQAPPVLRNAPAKRPVN